VSVPRGTHVSRSRIEIEFEIGLSTSTRSFDVVPPPFVFDMVGNGQLDRGGSSAAL
jgi:hypothetical protein